MTVASVAVRCALPQLQHAVMMPRESASPFFLGAPPSCCCMPPCRTPPLMRRAGHMPPASLKPSTCNSRPSPACVRLRLRHGGSGHGRHDTGADDHGRGRGQSANGTAGLRRLSQTVCLCAPAGGRSGAGGAERNAAAVGAAVPAIVLSAVATGTVDREKRAPPKAQQAKTA